MNNTKCAWIVFLGTIIAALIGGLFSYYGPKKITFKKLEAAPTMPSTGSIKKKVLKHMNNTKCAWIVFLGTIIAALIGGLFSYYGPKKNNIQRLEAAPTMPSIESTKKRGSATKIISAEDIWRESPPMPSTWSTEKNDR